MPDVLNRSSSDEAFLESNSDNKTTPLDEKDKIDPSSMHTKQAIPFVSSHQQMSSMTYDKLEMPTASNDTLPPSSNKEIPDSSRRNLSSLSGSKSPSSNFDVERLPYTRHKEESANVSGFETKMSTPSLRPGIEMIINNVGYFFKCDQIQVTVQQFKINSYPFLIIFQVQLGCQRRFYLYHPNQNLFQILC